MGKTEIKHLQFIFAWFLQLKFQKKETFKSLSNVILK